jgi:TetR/AcrR family transcriptional regulator, lmrAB and yxaGH operons repressor
MTSTAPSPAAPPSPPAEPTKPGGDTRQRILRSAMHLFRKRGFHGVGIADILERAQAPKGSMYHHFPGGKEEIGVAVIEEITRSLLGVFDGLAGLPTQTMITQAGKQLTLTMEKTQHELCALFSGFVAERSTSPRLGEAVAKAYRDMLVPLQSRLSADGFTPAAARDTALTVVMLLEGGTILSHTQQSTSAFKLAVRQAALLCAVQPGKG